jgi:hypothetical protein
MQAPVLIDRDHPADPFASPRPPACQSTGWKPWALAAASRSWELGRCIIGWLPVTPLGLIAAPLLWWIFEAYGRARQDAVVFALAGCGMLLIGAAVVLVLLSALWLRIRTHRTPDEPLEMEAGRAFRTGFRLGRAHWNPLLKIDLAWDAPQGVTVRGVVSGGRLEEEATAGARRASPSAALVPSPSVCFPPAPRCACWT